MRFAREIADCNVKVSSTRLDREVAAGRVQYHDAVPGAAFKFQARHVANQPAEVAPAQLSAKRELRSRLFRAQQRALDVKDTLIPGVGPGMKHYTAYAPESSGRFLRSILSANPVRSVGAQFHTLGMSGHGGHIAESAMLPAHPMDRSLNLGMLQHEVGERNMARGLDTGVPVTPFASHLGAEPIIRENLAIAGDAQAQNFVSRMRQRDTGDRTVQQELRRVGNHPDSPIPLEGRQSRALDKVLQRRFSKDPKLIGAGREPALRLAAIAGPSAVSYKVPHEAMQAIHPDRLTGVAKDIAESRSGGLRHLGRTIGKHLAEYGPHVKALSKFMA